LPASPPQIFSSHFVSPASPRKADRSQFPHHHHKFLSRAGKIVRPASPPQIFSHGYRAAFQHHNHLAFPAPPPQIFSHGNPPVKTAASCARITTTKPA